MPFPKEPAWTRDFRRQILTWYRAHGRSLPWRATSDPYRIWVSEIMLQQTRVAAVLQHYREFLKRFPTVRSLAASEEADVLAAWSGLGYYRRARMLHRAARQLAASHAARIPRTAAELRRLPGVGRYTSNAIASIAFGEPAAVVDGNVERVLARILGRKVAREKLWSAAQNLLDPAAPGDFNQAMMELGATVCVPGMPLCRGCPVKRYCASAGVEKKRSSIPETRLHRSASLLLIQRNRSVLLRQRSREEPLMPEMWELPRSIRKPRGQALLKVKHSITVTDWKVSVFPGKAEGKDPAARWIPLADAEQFPLTGLTRKILRRLDLIAWNGDGR